MNLDLSLVPYITQPVRVSGLRFAQVETENGTVGARIQFATVAVTLLGICLAGTAQYQDRDFYRTSRTSKAAPPPESRIDINYATLDQLLKAPGMTRSWAGRIVRFRPYRSKQDLLDKGVLTKAVYGRIKDYVIAHRNKQ